MSDTTQIVEALARDVRERLDSLDARMTDDALGTQVQSIINGLADDPSSDFVRKIRFAQGDARLAGSKYARYGLTPGDIELLHSLVLTNHRAGKGSPPSEALDNAFAAVSGGKYMDAVSAKAADVRKLEDMMQEGHLDSAGFQRALKAVDQVHGTRAMDTAETGYGLELVGAQYAGDLWAGARSASRIFSLIPQFMMDAPTTYLPVEADIPEMLFVGQSTASNSANYTTSKTGSNQVQVDAKKFVIHQMWSGEMEEDSLVAFVVMLRQQAQRSVEFYSDSLVMNGDTTNAATGNINLDDADPADTKHYLAFDGIRHAALVDNTGNTSDANGVLTYDKLQGLRTLCIDRTYNHDWGHPTDPTDFVYAVNPEGADEISKLDEVITVDKYGSNAVVLNGEVGNIGRNPLISAMAISRTEADGKVSTTAGNNIKEQVVAFNRRGFVTGIRRSLRVETERLPASDQTRIVYSLRAGFGRFSSTGAAAGIEAAAVLYDI